MSETSKRWSMGKVLLVILIALVVIVLAIGMFNAIFPGGPDGSGVHR